MNEHVPVLFAEVISGLRPGPGGLFIDGTVGAGGHAAGLLQASAPDGRLLAFDRDAAALDFARQQLASFGGRVTFVQESYAAMVRLGPEFGFKAVDGILLDLGLSSRQLDDPQRGFSFRFEGPLDMRFDRSQGPTAAELVNNLAESELAEIFWRYGEVRQSRRLAAAVVRARPIDTTARLAELAEQTLSRRPGRSRRHPATQLFQALRIAVNDELETVAAGLDAALTLLSPGGRMAVISFHSLEDRLVKHFIRRQSQDCICPPEQPVCTCDVEPLLEPVSRKAIQATEAEIAANPRSRSARLRVAERTVAPLENGPGAE